MIESSLLRNIHRLARARAFAGSLIIRVRLFVSASYDDAPSVSFAPV